MFPVRLRLAAVVFALVTAAPVVHAQFAVIDVAAVTQLVTEVQNLEQALTVARDHLAEAQAQLRSMSGDRGMERLLAGTDRNYLPASWAQITAALDGTGTAYPQLSAGIRQALAEDQVLTPQQVETLSPDGQRQVAADRGTAALLQALSRQALAVASGRFAELQRLIDAIGTAADQKSILDLNARISAEQVMLENEQTKLAMLVAAAQAQRWADEEQDRERAVAGVGDFATRFQPRP
jgi:type IV secretion system protein VirB5